MFVLKKTCFGFYGAPRTVCFKDVFQFLRGPSGGLKNNNNNNNNNVVQFLRGAGAVFLKNKTKHVFRCLRGPTGGVVF